MGFVTKPIKKVAGSVFGSDKQKTTTSQSLPGYIQRGHQRAFDIAEDIAAQPYQPYENRRVAGRTQGERQAYDMARRTAGRGGEMAEAGFGLASDVGGTRWGQDQAQRYMNPFIEAALNPAIRRLNEEAQQNAIGARAGMVQGGGVGAFGDARTAILEGQLEESRLRGVGDVLSQGYARAYESGRAGFEDEQARRLRAADLMGTTGGRYQAVTGAGIENLLRTGGTLRGIEQAKLDTDYEDYLDERDWQQRGLDAYVRALGGPTPTKTETTAPGPSRAQQAIGLGLGAGGLYSIFFGGG